MITKKQIQKRVLQNGNPIDMGKFEWDEKTMTFSSLECALVFDFNGINGCTFKTGHRCTFKTGSVCTFDTGSNCTFKTGYSCTFDTGSNCTFKTGHRCTFDTGSNCIFDTVSGCTFKTEYSCIFDTVSDCTFDTGSGCIFDTVSDCTFDTGSGCTFNTGHSCTFKVGRESVVIRRDIFEVIKLNETKVTQLFPVNMRGYLEDGMYKGKRYIIADDILSEVIHQKEDVYKVIIYGETEESYVVKKDDVYSHGKTLKEAYSNLAYKVSNRDTSDFKHVTINDSLPFSELIRMYRTITGACEYGMKSFIKSKNIEQRDYKLSEVLKLIKGQYGYETFKTFIEQNQ